MRWSWFRNTYDNMPKRMEGAWDQFCTVASDIHYPDPHMDAAEAKKGQAAWSPAVWEEGATRGVDHILGAELIPMDFDNTHKEIVGYNDNGSQIVSITQVENPASMLEVARSLQAQGIRAIFYTSFSNQPKSHCDPAWEKFRVAIPTNRWILPEEYEQAVEYTLEALGLNQWRHCLDIKSMRDKAHIYYTPAAWYAPAERYVTEGQPVAIPTGLTQPIPDIPSLPLSAEAQAQLTQLNLELKWGDDTYWWLPLGINMSSLNLPALLRDSGYWVDEPKPYKGGLRYQCECPFWREHSDPTQRRGAAIIEWADPNAWPFFDCKHSHELKLKQLLTQHEKWTK